MRRPILLLASSLLSFALACPRVACAGDWLPVLECTADASSPDSIALSFVILNHHDIPLCKMVIEPWSQAGFAAVPFVVSVSTEGWSCEPDSIPGAFVVEGCVQGWGISPLITIRSPARQFPVRARFFAADGRLARTWQDLLTCPAAVTPAMPTSFGHVKSIYRE